MLKNNRIVLAPFLVMIAALACPVIKMVGKERMAGNRIARFCALQSTLFYPLLSA